MMEFYVSGQSLKMFTPVTAADRSSAPVRRRRLPGARSPTPDNIFTNI